MKRSMPAVILLLVTLIFVFFGTQYIEAKTTEMIDLLDKAHIACMSGEYNDSAKLIDQYQSAYKADERILILLVRHDMLAELTRIVSPLKNYAYEETKHDFCVEATRAIEQLEVIREAQFRLI